MAVVDGLITVVIPTLDRAWCLPRAVESVLAQRGAPFRLVVVDDGSTDGTSGYLRPLADKGLIDLVEHPRPRGVAAARNSGLRLARGDLVAFLDSDDEWLPGKLAAQRREMDDDPSLAFSQCLERWVRDGRRVNPGRRHLKMAGDIFVASLSRCLVSPSAAVVRTRVLAEVGLFDESLPACEDYDFWLRLLARHEAGLLPLELAVRHAGHPGQLSARPGLDRWRIRSLKGLLRTRLLTGERRAAAEAELARRRAVYEAGRRRRARLGEAAPGGGEADR